MTGLAPDQSQRDIATDINRSVIVQAPAGSGKTTLLVERYLNLLCVVEKPEEILAITFTRKAASEMQNRIFDALDRASADRAAGRAPVSAAGDALARSDLLGWQLLDQPGRLKIQTIDSFAMALTRSLPLASGFDPSQSLTESAQDLYRQAANQLLMRLYEASPLTDEIADFLRQCDNDSARAERLLANMLGKRDQWLEVISTVVATARDHPEQVARVLELGAEALNAEVIDRFQDTLGASTSLELGALIAHASTELGRDLSRPHEYYRFAAELLTTARGEFRKQVTRREGFTTSHPDMKARVMSLIGQLAERELESQVTNLRYLPDPLFDTETVDRLVTVCTSLALANAELIDLFQRSKLCDFTTLILNAQRALGGDQDPTELALALDYRIHHILVDEFQDTSVSQFRLFEMLLRGWTPGDGNSFFAVGDPMQSIYRFRDAEVGLFFQAWEQGIADLTLEPVVLTSNFRADPELVTWTNHAFGTIMGDAQDPVLGQIGYRVATATRSSDQVQRGVELELSQSAHAQVLSITRKIEDLLASTDGSIAVLVRSRGHLRELIETLRQRGISWHANDIDPLLNKPAVQDLLSLAGALQNPRDRLSWFSLFRSPMVGLTLADLHALSNIENFAVLLTDLSEPPLSESGRARLSRLATIWIPLAARLDEFPIRSILESIWLQLGGTDAYPDPSAVQHAARLLELIDRLGPQTPSVEALTQAASSLFATDITESRLEILTIHKAKGLEFDHVLVPYLERAPRADETALLLWRALPHGLLMGLKNDAGPFDWLARENRLRDRHERQRLLYVACTRARQSLTLFATAGGKPAETTMFAMLWPMLERGDLGNLQLIDSEPAALPEQAELFTSPSPEPVFHRPLQRLKDGYSWTKPARPRLTSRPRLQDHRTADPLGKRFEVVLGIVIHSALESLADQPLPVDPDRWIEDQRQRWQLLASSHDLDEQDVERTVVGTAEQLHRVLQDATGRWLLDSQPEGRAELAVTGIIEGQIESLVIDRTFVSEGYRWIVDYKTAIPPPGMDPTVFIRSEVARYRTQLTAYAIVAEALFKQQTRLAIYFTAIPHLELLA